MFTLSLQKRSTLVAGLATAVSVVGAAIAPAANAASFDAASWSAIGDVRLSPAPITLTTYGDATDDSGLVGSFNVSPNLAVQNLDTFLGVVPGSLDFQEGSGIKKTFDALEGDRLTFIWNFLTNEGEPNGPVPPKNDFAFFVVNGVVVNPAIAQVIDATQPSSPFFRQYSGVFEYVFPSSGSYTVGLGIADFEDFSGTSAIEVNSQYTPIPTPALLPGLVGLSLAALRKRKSERSAG